MQGLVNGERPGPLGWANERGAEPCNQPPVSYGLLLVGTPFKRGGRSRPATLVVGPSALAAWVGWAPVRDGCAGGCTLVWGRRVDCMRREPQ